MNFLSISIVFFFRKINQMQSEFQREKELFQNAIDQWANRYEDLKAKLDVNRNQTDCAAVRNKVLFKNKLDGSIFSISKENIQLKEKIQQLEQTISELQTETETIGRINSKSVRFRNILVLFSR